MLKILLIILGLALYGAHTLMAKFGADTASATEKKQSVMAKGSSIADLLLENTATAAGMTIIPTSGDCENNQLASPEITAALMQGLPEASQQLVRQLADKIPAMPYKSDAGVGLCLPTQRKLVIYRLDSAVSAK